MHGSDRTAPTPLRFAGLPTPMQRCDRLGGVLGLEPGMLHVKRDDLTLFGGGGNKARKLEYLCGDAMALGHTTIVTGGALQSNHVRLTAVAAAMHGLDCVAVLPGDPPSAWEGNPVIDRLVGVEMVFVGDRYSDRLDEAIADEADRRNAYLAPLGGSTPVGALGYLDAADEIDSQGPADSLVVHAEGSGGTHAGLVAGFGDHRRVSAVDVGAVNDVASKVTELARATARLAGRPDPLGDAQVIRGFVGRGYGARTEATREAITLMARHEGILLDPVYSGKAFGGLVHMIREGQIEADRPVVFVHTGGLPALFTSKYASWIGDDG